MNSKEFPKRQKNQAICPDNKDFDITKNVDEKDGSLASSDSDNKIMHTILPTDKSAEKGDLISEALSKNLSAFQADMMFKNLVSNFQSAKKIYGETILRKITGYGIEEIERNVKIPEFQKDLKEKIKKSISKLKKDKILDKTGKFTEKAFSLAKISLLSTLDEKLSKSIFGNKISEHNDIYGTKSDTTKYWKGANYKDIAIKSSVKNAIRRGHKKLLVEDLKIYKRKAKRSSTLVYVIDASGSMQGIKIKAAKEAGLSLAYYALENKDRVGLVVFSSEVTETVEPTSDFNELLDSLVKISAKGKTDFVKALKSTEELLANEKNSKRIVIISDALPSAGEKPEEEAIEEALRLKHNDISISIIGIALTQEGKEFGIRLAEECDGKFYILNNPEELNNIVLEDYFSM